MSKNKSVDAKGFRKFGMVDKLAYAAGDFGCNMSFALKGTLTLFWTQFMKVDEAAIAGLLILVQVWDAINDPVIGAMIDADRRKYKLGKFRAYIFAGSVGLLVAGALCFIPWVGAPDIAKKIFFVAGYVIWDAFYTVANVPYGSMMPLITEDPGERAQLSSWRSLGSMVGNMATMAVLPMLIYDENNQLIGQRVFVVALVMGFLGFLAFQFMIRNTVERVEVNVTCKEDAPKFNLGKALVNFAKNRPAVGATVAACAMFIGMYGAQTASQVMFQAYFKNARISGIIALFSMLPMFLFMPFIRKIVSKWGTKEAASIGVMVTVIGYGLIVVLPITPDGKGIAMYVGCQLIAGLGNGIYTCVSWSMMAAALDYGEWKTGVREEGTTYAMHSFFRKLAQGVGPSLGLMVATALGYSAALGAEQPYEIALKMRYLTAGSYLLAGVLELVGIAVIYNLNQKTFAKMTEELNERRAAQK